jgi:hypothetical protein
MAARALPKPIKPMRTPSVTAKPEPPAEPPNIYYKDESVLWRLYSWWVGRS